MKKLYLLVVGLLCFNIVEASIIKSIGTPFIRNYNRYDYNGGSQTWAIQHAYNGMMYFANNDGLLEFDGKQWATYALPNTSILRAIKNGPDSLLYAGGFDELGYFKLGEMGGAKYYSLIDLIPEDKRNFGEIWKIYIHPDGIIFQTFTQIMIYKNHKFDIIMAPSMFHFSFVVNNEYYINDRQMGLMRYALGSLYPLIGTEKLVGKEIWGMTDYGNKLLISTSSDGYFIYNGNILTEGNSLSNEFLKQNQIYCNLKLGSDELVFGTIQKGLLFTDQLGNPIQNLSMDDGLPNNTILCLEVDKSGNLWLGTDHGIGYIEISSPITSLSNNFGLSTGYAAIVKDENLYLGTNQGLFVKKINEFNSFNENSKKLEMISSTMGQVWNLTNIDGTLFCGHNNGTFIIEDKMATQISDIGGGWNYLQIPSNKSKIISGTYTGLSLYSKENGRWRFVKQYKEFIESARSMQFDKDGSLWIVHGYKGIYHILFDQNYDSILKFDHYNSENSNLTSQVLDVVDINGNLSFTTRDGIYKYSKGKNNFDKNEELDELFNSQNVEKVFKDNEGGYWYFIDKTVGVLRKREDGKYNNIKLPFAQLEGNFVNSFEFVYSYDINNIFIATENGFVHYNPMQSNKIKSYPFLAYLRNVDIKNNNQSLGDTNIENLVLEYEQNDIAFIYSANDYVNPDKILFSTILDGYQSEWTEWQFKNTREFTNLFEGDYTFKVKAKNTRSQESNIVSFSFKVNPPFFRSKVAFFIYFLIFIGIIFLIVYIIKRRFEKAKNQSKLRQEEVFRKKEEQLQRETLEKEKEIIKMRNDKLRQEMKVKDKELANSTMQMLQKNEILIKLKEELKKLALSSKDETSIHEVKHLLRKINKEIDSENQWKVFETHFESVHEEFLKRIKQEYPNLTPRELKLCAYLRMNISSKEISVLMNISTRGVEITRYRLRKKLDLNRKTNLTDFILSF